jgi:hypothetical protein
MRNIITILITLVIIAETAFADSINVEWIKQFTSKTDGRDLVIRTDSEGFIYLAGTFTSESQGTEWKLIKLSPNSDTIYTRSFNSEGTGNDFLNAIEIDQSDNIYLTGRFYYSSSKTLFTIIKLNKVGQVQWQFNSAPLDGTYEGNYIQIDTFSNVYVGGNISNNNNSDFFIFKLDADGDSIWRYRAGTDNNSIIKGLKLFDGKVIAAGDIYRNSTWDILLVGLNYNAALQFEEYFSGRSGGDDICNDIAVDDNNIYVAGYSTNNGTKDYVTIKFAADGRIQWYALFDDSQKDDEAVSIIKFDDLIVVTGNVLTGQSGFEHKDIVTIAYDYDGIQVWRHKFNGRSSGDDIAVKVKNNFNNQIVVSGYSWSNETNFDGYLLNYDRNGEIIWTHSYNDSVSGANFLSDINIDFLGNIYVTYLTFDTESFKAEIVKVNQPDKFITVLKDYLKTLTVGLLDASADSIVKHYIYESCANAADSLFFITYPALIDSCTANGYNLKEAMNNKISDFFNLPSRDHVDFILKRMWVMGNRFSPLLIVPHFSHFTQTELEANPKLAYVYEEKDYPIPCLNCEGGSIDKTGTESNVTWGTFLTANPLVYVNGDPSIYITNCYVNLNPIKANRCMVCPVPGTDPIQIGPSQNPGHHEIEINIGYNGNSGFPTDNCFLSINPTITFYGNDPPNTLPDNYARLSRVGNLPYYAAVLNSNPGSVMKSVKKVTHPIFDRLYYTYLTGNPFVSEPTNWFYGDILTLCKIKTLFHSYYEMVGRFGLAHGIYKLDRPGVNQPPVYFAFPFTQGLWYKGGPDMGIFYGLNEILGNYCHSGHRELSQDYFTQQCEFCNTGPIALNIPTQDILKYIATTDFNSINDFWSESKITIGFRHSSGLSTPSYLSGVPGLNVHVFEAINNPTPCTPPSGVLVTVLELLPDNEYQFETNFADIAPGTDVTIHVIANYNNGKSIDECRTVTLMDNSDPQSPQIISFKNIIVNLRGDIKDYNSSIVNYLIKVYQ